MLHEKKQLLIAMQIFASAGKSVLHREQTTVGSWSRKNECMFALQVFQ